MSAVEPLELAHRLAELLEHIAQGHEERLALRVVAAWIRDIRPISDAARFNLKPLPQEDRPQEGPARGRIAVWWAEIEDLIEEFDGRADDVGRLCNRLRDLPRHPVRG